MEVVLKINAKVLCAGLAAAALLGCIRTPGGVAASSTPLNGRPYEILGPAYGAETQYHILGFIPTGKAALVEHAMAEAKRTTGADALIEVTVETYRKDFVVFASTTTEVRGKAIKFTR